MKLNSEKNLDGNQGRSAEVGPVSETLVDNPLDEGEQTLIRPDFEPGEDLEREEMERTEEASERSEVEPRVEVLFRGMSKSETKTHKRRKEQSSLVKKSKNAMMSSISPSEERTESKAKKSWKSLYDERMASLRTESLSSCYDPPEITHPDVDFTPCPRNDMSRKLTSSSLDLTPALGSAGDISDMFAGVMTGLEELRRDITKRIDRVEEGAHQGQEKLRDELTHKVACESQSGSIDSQHRSMPGGELGSGEQGVRRKRSYNDNGRSSIF